MTTPAHTVYLGIRGYAIALSRSTGEERWRTNLKGAEFVNLTLDGDQLLATTKGEIYCLDATTGEIRWHNTLSGCGWGIATVVTAAAPTHSIGPEAEERRRQEEAATAAEANKA